MQYCAGGSVADICCEVLARRCRYSTNVAPSQADAGARAACTYRVACISAGCDLAAYQS